jgi:DNA-binding transcriptional ArsR family regulator
MSGVAATKIATKPATVPMSEPDIWRALANPWRRRILDLLRGGPVSTGALTRQIPELSRFAVMQHLGVLVEANLLLAERRGRDRLNHLNAVPLREFYERWVQPFADTTSAELLSLKRMAEGETPVSQINEPIRTVRLAFELRINASARRTFQVMTQQSLDWFPHTYGGDRTRRVIVEPRIGGLHYEDWGDSAGHLYGQVTLYDPPTRWATRGRLSGGSILDTDYELVEEDGTVVVRVSKVAVGPFSDDEVAGINEFGDIRPYASVIERLAAD